MSIPIINKGVINIVTQRPGTAMYKLKSFNNPIKHPNYPTSATVRHINTANRSATRR